MEFDANIPHYLFKRQSNISNFCNSNFFRKKILSSVFESSNSLFYCRKNWGYGFTNFCFSEDGKFFATAYRILKLNEDLSIENSRSLKKKSGFANGIAFNNQSTKIFANIPKRLNIASSFFVHDIETNKTIEQKSTGLDFVDISVDTFNDNFFTTCSTSGNVFLNDLRYSKIVSIYEEKKKIKSSQFHPKNSNLLLLVPKSGNEIFLYDIRNRKGVFYFDSIYNHNLNDCHSSFNKKGDQILVSSKNSNPVVYEENNPYPVFEFDHFGFKSLLYDVEYLRSSCFAGPNDEFVVCSSLDCNVYVWKIPNKHLVENETKGNTIKVNSAKFVLNHDALTKVNYSHSKSILICLEKEYKLWSPFKLNCKSDQRREKKKKKDVFRNLYHNILCEFNQTIFFASHKEFFHKKIENFCQKDIFDFVGKDLNINHIKNFINNYTFNFKHQNLKIIESIDKLLNNQNLQVNFFETNYSLVYELIKAYRTKIFIKKSVFYLNKQLDGIEKLKRSVFSEKKEARYDMDIKLIEYEKTKIILKSMIYDLEIIIRQNFRIYEKPIDLVFSIIKTFSEIDIQLKTSFRNYFTESFVKKCTKLDDPNFFIGEKSMTLENEEKNCFLVSIMNKTATFFEKELSKSKIELKQKLKTKKNLLNSFEDKNYHDKNLN